MCSPPSAAAPLAVRILRALAGFVVLLFVGTGCAGATLQALPEPPAPLAIVPGCPSEPDGTLSACQWRRVVWAHHLWASGLARGFVVSGNAVYNRYVEAEALAAGLVALGVPASRIALEPRALHTDENIAYALRIAESRRERLVTVASDGVQANGSCAMVRAWTRGEIDCIPAPIDYAWAKARMARGLPEVRTSPVPADSWLSLEERERRIAAQTGWRRPPSMLLYAQNALLRPFGLARPPRLPE